MKAFASLVHFLSLGELFDNFIKVVKNMAD